jgi:hypothetical protein
MEPSKAKSGVTRAVAEVLGPVSAYEGFFVTRKTENGYAAAGAVAQTAP